MNNSTELSTLWTFLDNITNNLKSQRLADVFRFISFYPLRPMDLTNICVLRLTMLKGQLHSVFGQ